MQGTVVAINRATQSGTIRSDEDSALSFRRAGLASWSAFLDLRLGDRVRFDADHGRAINVEPLAPQMRPILGRVI